MHTPTLEDFYEFTRLSHITLNDNDPKIKIIDEYMSISELEIELDYIPPNTKVRFYQNKTRVTKGDLCVEIPKYTDYDTFLFHITRFNNTVEYRIILDLFSVKNGQDGIDIKDDDRGVISIRKDFGRSSVVFYINSVDDLPQALRMMGYSSVNKIAQLDD